MTPKGVKRIVISIVDADGERIIISHTAASIMIPPGSFQQKLPSGVCHTYRDSLDVESEDDF